MAKLLREHGYSLQALNKSVAGTQHPDRNAQFEHINAKAKSYIKRGVPVISIDTKKKELVGNFNMVAVNGNRRASPNWSMSMIFPSDAVGKAIGDWNYVIKPRADRR